MKLGRIVFLQVLLLLLFCIPAMASADSSPRVSLTLSKTTASVDDDVTVSGETGPNAWVPLKVIDDAGNILVFDARKADANGYYSIDFIVPDSASGVLTVVIGEGSNVTTGTLAVKTRPSGGGGGGGSGGGSSQSPPEPIQEPEPGEPDLPAPLEAPADLKGHWAYDCIMSLLEQGIIAGYPDGSFKPDNTITRAEFATVLVKAFKLETHSGISFTDTIGHWAQSSISTAACHGIVKGYDTDTFGPDDFITREQMAVMIVKAAQLTPVAGDLPFTDSGSISAWAREAVVTAAENGIMSGYPDNTFHPLGNATRAEAMTVITNALNTPGQ
ncbi:MAG: S-layer homology domain-containing protein [Desulfotomaculaceae bacterium]|nr:S-layer homology domain-containing protein [Desulfotomaculaceae bacterium]MDD4767209.1 S-layer homology domain-containing protein [Desulfotomaculaceae bacterium]